MRRASLRGVLLLMLGGVLVAACGTLPPVKVPKNRATTTSAAPTTSATTTSTTTTTTSPAPTTTTAATTTTTTLPPVEIDVPGTRAGALGSIERVAVLPVADGSSTLPPPPTTTTAVASSSTTLPRPGSIEIAFRQFGSGPDLLLVGGEHASMNSWDPALLDLLSQHYTVTEFDLPGTGYSAPDAAAVSIEQVADLTAGLSVTLGLDAPAVVGWGLGGQIALSFVERHPGLAGAIVLLDSSAGGPNAQRPSSLVVAGLGSPNETPLELADFDFPASATASQGGFLARIGRLPADDLVTSAVTDEALLQSSAFSDASIGADLSAVTVPALVVVGSLDEVFPPANSSLLAHELPHARELVLPGAGYASTSQDAAQFALALTAFTADLVT